MTPGSPGPHVTAGNTEALYFAVGVVLGSLPPAGLVASGVLVGLVAPTRRRALLFGIYLGGLVLLVVGLAFPTLGAHGVRGVV